MDISIQVMMKFDEIFDIYGHIGKYQLFIFAIITGPLLISNGSAYNFLSARMDHWCYVDGLQNLTHEEQKLVSIPLADDGDYEQCLMFDVNYTVHNGVTRPPNTTHTRPCDDGWVYNRSQFTETTVSAVSTNINLMLCEYVKIEIEWKCKWTKYLDHN